MPSANDRQEAAAARAEYLRENPEPPIPGAVDPDAPADTAESVQADADVPQPEVQISATFVQDGIEVVILIPHEGITIDLPDLPNTLQAHGGQE